MCLKYIGLSFLHVPGECHTKPDPDVFEMNQRNKAESETGLNIAMRLLCIFHDDYMLITFIFSVCLNKANQYLKSRMRLQYLTIELLCLVVCHKGNIFSPVLLEVLVKSLQCLKELITLLSFVFHY